ncbi:MAG: ElyC/SanA/YdcF family protein [Kocuria sp.]|nr:ElyC/SanA/YdcF family protein [Kocuria sp.]
MHWIRRTARILGTVIGSAVVLTVVWLMVCTAVLIHPNVTENPEPADALLVLGPADPKRVEAAKKIMEDGKAPVVVYATPDPVEGTWPSDAEFIEERPHCDQQDLPYEVMCFKPNPSTTQGEAMKLRELAEERGWDNVMVLTYRPHVARSQMIIERCFDGTTQWPTFDYWGNDYPLTSRSTWREYVYQSAGFLKAWVTPGCDTQLPWQPKTEP